MYFKSAVRGALKEKKLLICSVCVVFFISPEMVMLCPAMAGPGKQPSKLPPLKNSSEEVGIWSSDTRTLIFKHLCSRFTLSVCCQLLWVTCSRFGQTRQFDRSVTRIRCMAWLTQMFCVRSSHLFRLMIRTVLIWTRAPKSIVSHGKGSSDVWQMFRASPSSMLIMPSIQLVAS